ncbi:MAG: CapA family protein [Chloroflexi bacterium]|nr:CapA family protein [Chloroflexota bacterium]MBP7045567.1 CapA family protein [Chloroflexota bacterium]
MNGRSPLFFTFISLLLILVACQQAEIVYPTPIMPAALANYTPPPANDAPPTPPITPLATNESAALSPTTETVPTPFPEPLGVSQGGTAWRVAISTAVPPNLQMQIQDMIQAAGGQFTWVGDGEGDVLIDVNGPRPFFTAVYAAAAPFATIDDAISLADLQAAWQISSEPLLVTGDTAAALTAVWGAPAPSVRIVSSEELVDDLWAERPSLTIVPFDQLQPELKTLRLDGISPLDKAFDPAGYPLTVPFGVSGAETAVNSFLAAWNQPTSNYQPDKFTRIALTGVTALVRATAYNMEQNGILWPAEDVAAVLQAADIAHVSNEVSFAPDCPYPNPIGGTTFCSRDNYFELMQFIGTDVVELTGNHLNDWGREYLLRTIDMYDAAGMATFGGGKDAADAAEPALFERNGNRIAFVGCNSFGPTYAWATADEPGARLCDDTMAAQIRQLADEGYLVIATLQYTEYYQYPPTPEQVVDFEALAAAGATAVSGSQGHHAQGFGFYEGRFIHYGPGNLFFDQMDMLGTRQTFVDTYTVYNGRLLNVDLWTGLIENYAKPRLMTTDERTQALTAVFQASGW